MARARAKSEVTPKKSVAVARRAPRAKAKITGSKSTVQASEPVKPQVNGRVATVKAKAVAVRNSRAFRTTASGVKVGTNLFAKSLVPAATIGAAAVAFDRTRTDSLAKGDSEVKADLKATGAAAVEGGQAAALGYGMMQGIKIAAKAHPALGAAALGASILYGVYKSVKGYQNSGLRGVGDVFTNKAVSHFASGDKQPPPPPPPPQPQIMAQRAAPAGVASAVKQAAANPRSIQTSDKSDPAKAQPFRRRYGRGPKAGTEEIVYRHGRA